MAAGAHIARTRPHPQKAGRASIRVHLPTLRHALGTRPELLESLEAGARKAAGKVGANVAMVWALAKKSLYISADVPVLGTREACQNGVDAARAAIAARQIRQGEGRFAVTWDPEARTLTWEDNGIAMDADTILNKFLVLGNSGKTAAADSNEAAGGFGIAKAVILGSSASFRWRMHTRDNLAVSNGPEGEVEIFSTTPRQGTEITVYDVSPEYDLWWDSAGGGRRPIEDRLRELLAANDLPGFTLLFNGEEIRPLFSRRGGSKIEVRGSWGEGTTATVKAYKRPDRRGAYWVRLNGLYQYKSGSSGDLGVDVVIDLTTRVRPGEQGYPLNAGRDALQGEARYTFRALVETIERENLSTGDKEEDEVFDPEPYLDDELADDLHALTQTLLEDPELAQVLGQAGLKPAMPLELPGGVAAGSDIDGSTFDSAGAAPTVPGDPEAIAGASSAGDEGAGGEPRPVLKTNLPDDYVLDLSGSKGRLPWFPAGLQTPGAIRSALERAEQESPYEIHPQAIDALEAAGTGTLTVGELRVIALEMDRAARSVARVRDPDRPKVSVSERKTRHRNGNPFGHLGALRISKNNYDRTRARTFKRNPRKWLPALLLWDTTLKLIAEAGGIARDIKPGFVLEDGTIGLAQRRADSPTTIIYIHPERLAEIVDQNREQPIAIAGFLHGTAAHELTHADGRMGSGHSEAFISAREDLGQRTSFLIPKLAALAVRLLKLPEPKDGTIAKLARLERDLAKAVESRKAVREEKVKQVWQLRRELAACRSEVQAQAQAASSQARAACTGACSCHRPPTVPAMVQVPPVSSAAPVEPSPGARRMLQAVIVALRTSPPPGIDLDYVNRFVARYGNRLAEVIEARLPIEPPPVTG